MSAARRVARRTSKGRRRGAASSPPRSRTQSAAPTLAVAVAVRKLPLTVSQLESLIAQAVAETRRRTRRRVRSLSIGVIGDAAMRRFNREFHAADETTDVLSFDLSEDSSIEAEILVCAPYARREALARGLPWQTEIVLYVVHGLLHLCGEDDHAAADARRMRRLESEILRRIELPLPGSHLLELKFDAG